MLGSSVIGVLQGVFGVTRETVHTIVTPGSSGRLKIRQSGGTIGTDEIQMWHDGTYGHLNNLNLTQGIQFDDSSVCYLYVSRNQVQTHGTAQYVWTNLGNNADAGQVLDTGLKRAAAGVVATTNASTGVGWLQNSAGRSRVASDVTNATTTFAAITGLSATLIAGRKYAGRLVLFCDDSVAGEGIKFDFNGGAATMTSFEAAVTSNVQGATLGTSVSAALATALNATAMNGTGRNAIVISFSLVCNAAGTFIPRMAQDSHASGTATVRTNSYLWIEDMP